jgi:hypothetical protein
MTAQHVVVSYPMADYAMYVPNMPLKMYDSEGVPNTTFSPEMLPNRVQTAVSLNKHDFSVGKYLIFPQK